MENIDFQYLNNAVATDYIEDILERAKNGDIRAAKDALVSIGHYLHCNNVNPETNEVMPVPIFIRDYLSKAFYDMANGKSLYFALNLKRAGQVNEHYLATREIAYMVYQRVHEHGQTIFNATIDVAEFINLKSINNELTGQLMAFKDKQLGNYHIQDMYYKHKKELKKMYENATIKPFM